MIGMNQKMSTIAAIMAVAALTGILVTAPMTVYADETETSTDQSLAQKNLGSGDSANFNCDENLIKAGVNEQECDAVDSESATLSVCKVVLLAPNGPSPEDFVFTVRGNSPFPAQFPGDENCVDVTIGPGEYTVSEVWPVPFGGRTEIEGNCIQDPPVGLTQRATGEIQAGETQECRFTNVLGP
jgi:hypothetical protein